MGIRVLDDNIVNQIAAGEVLERPFAAVKELIENAIDAGATQIEVSVEQGGKSYISVTDNGVGMSKDDLPLSLMRHATSKLPDDDLSNINHFGFRGEALPSIGSVARMAITSRKEGAEEAYKITVEGGNIGEVSPAPLNKGTKVEVRDMFYATPARLKFLKSDASENGKIEEVVKHIAMAEPFIAFTLKENGKIKLNFMVPKTDDVNDAFKERFTDILGEDFSENFCAIEHSSGKLSLKGFASLPTYTRGNSLYQFLFVNGRPVKDRLIFGAIKAAYEGLVPSGRYPVVALFLEVPPFFVDVNVHPAKAEVRFQDYSAVRGLIVSALKNTVAGIGFKVAGSLSEDTLAAFATHTGQAIGNNSSYSYLFSKDKFGGNKSNFRGGFNTDFIAGDRASFIGGSNSNKHSSTMPLPLKDSAFSAFDYSGAENNCTRENMETMPYDLAIPSSLPDILSQQLEPLSEQNTEESLPPLGLARAQLYETYIIAQSEDGIVIVDQHAAHERLTYEKISKMSGISASQLLLTPELIDVSEVQMTNLLAFKEELEGMGLLIESLGTDTIMVRGYPAVLKEPNIKGLIMDLIDTIDDFAGTLPLQARIKEICARMSCHGSVRAGRRLNISEMNALLRQMEASPNSGECIHGRPTYIKLKIKDIELLFGRR